MGQGWWRRRRNELTVRGFSGVSLLIVDEALRVEDEVEALMPCLRLSRRRSGGSSAAIVSASISNLRGESNDLALALALACWRVRVR